jgi:hypothetical protein
MKKTMTVLIAIGFIMFVMSDANSGILGDVDNDGKIGFPEAINALQVLSGAQTALPASFVIRWMGNWASGQNYQKYDAVQFGGSSYIALLAHTSSAANQPPDILTWNLMAQKGSLNPNVSMDAALYNTAVGISTLSSNTTGNLNTAVGDRALQANTDGYDNTAVGKNALLNNIKGNDNTATGTGALRDNTEGDNNTAGGSGALYSNTKGSYNTANGTAALHDNTEGYSNTASGSSALRNNTLGYRNTAVGVNAGYNQALADFTGSNNIYIGYNVVPGSDTESDTIRIGRIGTGGQTNTHIAGIYGTTISGSAVYVNSSGRLGIASSSRRYKEAIEDMGDASSGLMKLRPVAFNYRPEHSDGPRTVQYGLIAEEVAGVYPELVVYDPKTGEPETVSYHLVNAMLLNEVQKQHRKIQDLEERLAKLEARIGH